MSFCDEANLPEHLIRQSVSHVTGAAPERVLPVFVCLVFVVLSLLSSATFAVAAANDDPPVYSRTVLTFSNASVYDKGLQTGSRVEDAQGNPYTESGKTYRFVNVTTQQPIAREALPAQQSATIFPQVAEETSRFFEGEQQPGKQTRVAYLQ